MFCVCRALHTPDNLSLIVSYLELYVVLEGSGRRADWARLVRKASTLNPFPSESPEAHTLQL